jgi:hypothetical protein
MRACMKKAEQAAGFAVLDWQRVEAHLPEGWRELADEMKLIRARPAHMETKVSKIGDVLRLILHYAGAGATLRETVALAATLGILGISHVALHKWMRKAGPYLARLLSGKVGGREYCAEKWAGYEVIAGDATTVQRPGSLGTTARVHYALRLSDLSARQIEVTDDKEGETARRFRAEAGELWLLDRVYCTPPSIAWLQSRGADVIVRFNRGSLPLFDAEGHRINVDRLLDFSLVRQVAREVQVFVHGPDDEVIPARVCWLRLPPDKVEESKLRLQRQSDNTPDAEALVAAEVRVHGFASRLNLAGA